MALISYTFGGRSGVLDTSQGIDSDDARFLTRYLAELNGARLTLVQTGGAPGSLAAINARMTAVAAILP